MRETKHKLWAALALVVAALVVYAPVRDAGFIWDDDHYLLENELVHAPDGWVRFWTSEAVDFYPVSNTSLWLEWRLWGGDPTGYHVTNALLHVVNALLAWSVLAGLGLPGAWWAALFFALHPLNVASVAWIAERKNLLGLLFALLALRFWLAFEPGSSRRTWGCALAAFVLSLLSKPVAVTLPCVLLLLAWWRRRAITHADLLTTAPFFAIAGLLSFVNVHFQTTGAIGAEAELVRPEGFLSRLLAAGWALAYYLVRPFWPSDPAMVYPRWEVDPARALHWLPLALWVAACAVLWRLRTRPVARALFVALVAQALLLFPVLGFFDIYYFRYALVADHWQYLPMLAPLACATALAAGSFEARAPRAKIALGLVVAATLGALARQRVMHFASSVALWSDNVARYPSVPTAEFHLGVAHGMERRFEQALPHFERTLALDPGYGEAYANLAACYRQLGRPEAALGPLREATERRPALVEPWRELGLALYALERYPEAVRAFDAALERAPGDVAALVGKGNAHLLQGDLAQACAPYAAALDLRPDDVDTGMNLAQALEQLGRTDESARRYEAVLQLRPDLIHAHLRLAAIHARNGRSERAAEHWRSVLALEPSNAEALAGLGR
jgi:tetratricopeptide (TPR) repeat protein